jgi:hypothetical protein
MPWFDSRRFPPHVNGYNSEYSLTDTHIPAILLREYVESCLKKSQFSNILPHFTYIRKPVKNNNRRPHKTDAGHCKSNEIALRNYSSSGAPTGQASAQAPQPMQVSASITYLPSPSVIASTGQPAAQAPQATHASVILYAMIDTPPY